MAKPIQMPTPNVEEGGGEEDSGEATRTTKGTPSMSMDHTLLPYHQIHRQVEVEGMASIIADIAIMAIYPDIMLKTGPSLHQMDLHHRAQESRNGSSGPHQSRPQGPHQPRSHAVQPRENPAAQVEHLEALADQEIPKVVMGLAEFEEKEAFRRHLESVLQQAFAEQYSGDIATISLVGFGSLASGFGMPGSDMDLAVVPGWKDPSKANEIVIDREIPRLLERAVLDAKMGGRLLTRTRVPILKVCQKPTETLYDALCEERKKWDELPEEEQYPTDAPVEPSPLPDLLVDVEGAKSADSVQPAESPGLGDAFPELGSAPPPRRKKPTPKTSADAETAKAVTAKSPVEPQPTGDTAAGGQDKSHQNRPQHHREKAWMREKVLGPLDFPKDGVGILCDINFSNPLGIYNTHMLRCYSLTDPRVRLIVLFVKSWAKRRKINSSYSGTLSSYGWVLMVLHYLVNVTQPPVCPNLQLAVQPPKDVAQLEEFFKNTTISGYTVRFWRNEQEIIQAAQAGQLSQNRQSIGSLLRGFFQYYASISAYSYGPRPPQFYWTNEVLSLRTPGGIRSKQDKGWVSAKTTVTAEKKVTNRYLFAIEDPFELDHNVARTVTHRGIVAIRDEFRRAWRILSAIGRGVQPEGGIFDEVVESPLPPLTPKEAPEPADEPETGTIETLGINGEENSTPGKVQQTEEKPAGL
ncbi:PAP/OAS1 substrate-binding domain-containing protein [Setomelanomma holmii]|uniref:polynucleotide adenylyltransferase n=1 Tax=Setomelanomma holmii TaxID=210430 RepID=A0A9P4H6V7_9PLEO|nr:PAP/OAS1 substrate-binding domain-containing protein [Setomelanomma holmii]